MGSMSDYRFFKFLGYAPEDLEILECTGLALGTPERPQFLYILPFYFKGLEKGDFVDLWIPESSQYDNVPFTAAEEHPEIKLPVINHQAYATATLQKCLQPGTRRSELVLKVQGSDMHVLLQQRREDTRAHQEHIREVRKRFSARNLVSLCALYL